MLTKMMKKAFNIAYQKNDVEKMKILLRMNMFDMTEDEILQVKEYISKIKRRSALLNHAQNIMGGEFIK